MTTGPLDNKLPNIRHLRAFVTLAEHLHFNRAAEALSISQSVLSSQIKALENQLGVALFERNNRTVNISRSGAYLLPSAKQCVLQVNMFARVCEKVASGGIGHLRIGYVGSALFTEIVTRSIAEYKQEFDDITFEIQEMSYSRQFRDVRMGTLDIGVMRLPVHDPEGELRTVPLLEEDLMLAIPKNHPFAAYDEIPIKMLRHESIVTNTMSTVAGLRAQFTQACVEEGFVPTITARGATFSSALAWVDAGFGIALAPSSAKKMYFSNVTYRPVAPAMTSVLSAVVNPARPSAVVEKFLGYMTRDAGGVSAPSPVRARSAPSAAVNTRHQE